MNNYPKLENIERYAIVRGYVKAVRFTGVYRIGFSGREFYAKVLLSKKNPAYMEWIPEHLIMHRCNAGFLHTRETVKNHRNYKGEPVEQENLSYYI